jgi:hypothetical protein
MVFDERTQVAKATIKNTVSEPLTAEFGGNLKLGLRFNPKNILKFTVGAGQKKTADTIVTMVFKGTEESEDLDFGINISSDFTVRYNANLDLSYEHLFDKFGRKLTVSLLTNGFAEVRTSERAALGTYYDDVDLYQIQPLTVNVVPTASICYNDERFLGVERLKVQTGIDYSVTTVLDHYGGEVFDTHTQTWRDSTRLTQDYIYFQSKVSPFLKADWTYENISFRGQAFLQFFSEALLTKNEREDIMSRTDWDFPFSVGTTWKLSDKYKFNLDMRRSLSRPDYKKISSTFTIGASEGIYEIGNPKLKPAVANNIVISFIGTFGKFEVEPSVSYTYTKDKAERIIYILTDQEMALLKPKVKDVIVYSWINSAEQKNNSGTLKLRWKGTKFKADAWGTINSDTFTYQDKRSTKTDINYNCGGNASYNFKHDMTASAKVSFSSARRTAYSRYDDYVNGSVRFTKLFWKKLSVYLEGRDLLDKTMVIETFTEDMKYGNRKEYQYYRRAAVLGLSYKF